MTVLLFLITVILMVLGIISEIYLVHPIISAVITSILINLHIAMTVLSCIENSLGGIKNGISLCKEGKL